MIKAHDTKVVYIAGDDSSDTSDVVKIQLSPPLMNYFMARRRAIIAELRNIEYMTGLPQSIPVRQRPR